MPCRECRLEIEEIIRVNSTSNDAAVVAACLAGDHHAWDVLIDRYRRLIYSIPIRYHLPEADADDIFQAVAITLFQKLDTLQDFERLSAWLITTTHRECWRIGRARNRELDLEQDFADVSSPSDTDLARLEQQQIVRESLRQLGSPCQDLLEALFLEKGKPDYEQIAAQLGIKVGSIGPTRARCFRKLEPILMRLGIDDFTDP